MARQNDTRLKGTEQKVRELVDYHPTFHESDFEGCFSVLYNQFGLRKAIVEYLKGWFTALSECYKQGYGVDPRMATAFLNATINLKNRRGDYD